MLACCAAALDCRDRSGAGGTGPCSTTAMPLPICTLRGGSSIAHQPRLTQLGSVWLPLPHLLLIPFVQVYGWWANGIAGVIPSALAYLAACAGIYRLARRWLRPAAAALALAFFAAQSQSALPANHGHDRAALCLRDGLDRGLAGGVARQPGLQIRGKARRLHWLHRAALVAAIFTRYDGWIMALLAWSAHGPCAARRGAVALARLLAGQRPGDRRAGWRGLFTTPRPSAIGSTSCAGRIRPRPSRCAPPCRDFRRIRDGTIRGWR